MKKLFIVLMLVLFSIVSYSQERELSDYEKYRMEKESETYQTDEEVFYIVEDMPKFQGEDAEEFRKWITQNVRYPQDAIKDGINGKVIVFFVVNKEGKVVNAQIEKSVDVTLDAEAVRVVMSSPKWNPGKQRGEPVNVQFTFPINFVLDNQEQTEPMVINNYYIENDYPNYSRLLTFGYSYHYPYYDPFYYSYYPYYGYSTYGSWYGGYYNYYAYYGMYYPYSYGYGSYYPYYGHNRYYGHNNGQRYATTNALGWNRNYYSSKYNSYSSGYATRPQTQSVRPQITQRSTQAVRTQTTQRPTNAVRTQTTRSSNTRTTRPYNATYARPAANPRPEYNRQVTTQSRTVQRPQTQKSTTVRTPTQQRSSTSYTRPTSTTRSSTSYSRPTSTPSRSYSTPSRSYSSPSRSYSTPSRSSGSSSMSGSRPAGSSSSSRSGGATRR